MAEIKDETIYVSTQAELAICFGVTKRTIATWSKDGMPGKKKGAYNVEKIAKWKGISLDEPDENETEEDTRAYWEIQFRKWRAKLSKTMYEKARGELMPIEEVEKRETQLAAIFVNALTLYEDRLPPKLEGKTKTEMHKIIHNENNYVRSQLVAKHG